MNIAEAKEQVKNTVAAYLAKDAAGMYRIPPARQRPLFLVGAPGIGKTAIMAQVADELGVGLVSYSMTHHTRQSALGLPFIVHRDYGGKSYDVSEYTMSEIIASVYDYMEATGLDRGILFLDEINCVSETLYPSMLQFLQFKTFGRHRVPDGWIVACAGNPPEYNRAVHEFDIVTLDRLRKIEVEPDFEAWRTWALDQGIHPAILSFLDVKRDCFYSVESTPSGKRFVSARGWADLSDVLEVSEEMNMPTEAALIAQYVQDPDICDQFAQYLDLFNKYRADYQISDILDGNVSDDVRTRAEAAPFDERLALLGLLLDGVALRAGEAVAFEDEIRAVRDVLRAAKPELASGSSLADALGARIQVEEEALEKRLITETAAEEQVRVKRLMLANLHHLQACCEVEGALEGPAAFEVLQKNYAADVARLAPKVEAATKALDNAFAFIDEVFSGQRERLVFVADVTARRVLVRFVDRFGSESYFAHNEELMVDPQRERLIDRINSLALSDAAAPASDAAGNELAETLAGALVDPAAAATDEELEKALDGVDWIQGC